ncbi:sulfite exporter TauE/SafE family protein [Amycolatopsis acidiphila]|uniref:Probable membrane transporter protein n=1 Tax=Amycolatopsis acidiphila TaxID=715473 RepID=A0A558AK40_9PSEU|nr:sulfite exporter TauE/SafE family protein [Amycolatopsis acidiphila]TVT24561.1 sulfite exporter TauE/SafE family protein [Amycolatopsis acidiphila]UIJ58505.1 sulfite exporter TauE/SafE family protein [Amycolatopsis acidiphila]GHG77120.1 UPF0721 transmembrane protein [Amycolatopsis acidiphila]
MWEIVALVLVGVAGGALNAAGGGGTFLVLPALVLAGLPAVVANASTTVALLPGALASGWAFRRDVVPVGPVSLPALTIASLLGSAAGAALLLVLPAASFATAVPWLLAFATVVLLFGRGAIAVLGSRLRRPLRLGSSGVLIGQFVLAVYGGYFGGAVGILMLAFWAAGVGLDTATANPVRVCQLAAVFGIAAVFFVLAADVLSFPGEVGAVLGGAIVGGWSGAKLTRRLSPRTLRAVVLTTAVTMTVLYFVRR